MPAKTNTESLLAELEQILGMTKKEAVRLELKAQPEHLRQWARLIDTYRSIAEFARRELQSQYEHLFQMVGEVGTPVGLVIEAFAEEEKAPNWRAKRLFDAAIAQFNELLGAHGYEREGETYVPADRLVKVLENLIRPPGNGSFHDLYRNLETIIRLATPLRNAIGWAIANGHEADEQKQVQINLQLEILLGSYERTFAPEVRRKILYRSSSINSVAELIFGSSEYSDRPLQTVAAATRMESPAREGALGILASALAVDILQAPGFGEQRVAATYKKLQPHMDYVVLQLFSKDKVERLDDWMAKAKMFVTDPGEAFKEQLGDLAERLTNLESILSRGKRDKDERQVRLRVLIKNILEVLREETDDPYPYRQGQAVSIVGYYCDFLWENSVDNAFRGDHDKYEEWQWLELRRSITELALGFREGARFRSYGWRLDD
jgi:hypothetical protein